MTGGWSVTVEVLLLGLDDHGTVRVQRQAVPLPADAAPDEVALAVAGVAGSAGAVSHSTSWRHDGDGALVLTYAALPGPPGVGEPVRHPSVVTSGEPLRPQPADLHPHHVVAHAVLHLVALGARDPAFAGSRAALPALWSALEALAAATPTAEHREAHHLARDLAVTS